MLYLIWDLLLVIGKLLGQHSILDSFVEKSQTHCRTPSTKGIGKTHADVEECVLMCLMYDDCSHFSWNYPNSENCNQKCSMYREFALHFYGTSAPRRSVHVRSQRYVLHDTTGRTDASWDTLRTWRTDPKMHLERALSLEDTSICVQ